MTLVNLGTTTNPITYTPAEIDALVAAVRAKMNAQANEDRWEIAIPYAQLHMMAGHKAADI